MVFVENCNNNKNNSNDNDIEHDNANNNDNSDNNQGLDVCMSCHSNNKARVVCCFIVSVAVVCCPLFDWTVTS